MKEKVKMKAPMERWSWLGCVLLLLATVSPSWAFYNPSTGRWLNRDPITERGGENVYGFIENDTASSFDAHGLEKGAEALLCRRCCVSSADVKVSGPFDGNTTINDYFPDLAGSTLVSNQPGRAGTFSNGDFVGGQVQITSSANGECGPCTLSQLVTVVSEVIDGNPTGRANPPLGNA